MAFRTDFNFSPDKLYYKNKDLKYLVSYRPNITASHLNNIFYKLMGSNAAFAVSNMTTADRVVDGVTTFDACDCVGEGVDIGYSGMFNAVGTYKQAFLKAGYNPHLTLSGSTNTALIYKTDDASGWKNKRGDNYYVIFEISRSDSKITIRRNYSTVGKWESHTTIPANSFDQGVIPYVFMFYVQAAGGGGGPSFGLSGGAGGGGGGACIFMYNFSSGNKLYIRLGAPGAGGNYSNSDPQGGTASLSLIYDDTQDFNIILYGGGGASRATSSSNIISNGGFGGDVVFSSSMYPTVSPVNITYFNNYHTDRCFAMCSGAGGAGGNCAPTSSIGEKGSGASMTYRDNVATWTFAHPGGSAQFDNYDGGAGGGGSATSDGMSASTENNQDGTSAASYDRGNGGSGATTKGFAIKSHPGGNGGRPGFEIWY